MGCGKSVPEISIYDAAEKGDIAAVKQHQLRRMKSRFESIRGEAFSDKNNSRIEYQTKLYAFQKIMWTISMVRTDTGFSCVTMLVAMTKM